MLETVARIPEHVITAARENGVVAGVMVVSLDGTVRGKIESIDEMGYAHIDTYIVIGVEKLRPETPEEYEIHLKRELD